MKKLHKCFPKFLAKSKTVAKSTAPANGPGHCSHAQKPHSINTKTLGPSSCDRKRSNFVAGNPALKVLRDVILLVHVHRFIVLAAETCSFGKDKHTLRHEVHLEHKWG